MREATTVKELPHQHDNCDEIPAWVKVLCTTVFSDPCNSHPNSKKNSFCIDCLESFCCNCLPSHANHKHVKIRKYVYCEVILRQDIFKFFDCSGIQTYHTNKDRVIFVKQRSKQHSLQYSQNNVRFMHKCIICDRSLHTSVYCSIACKVLAMSRGEHVKEETSRHLDEKEEELCDYGDNTSDTLISPKRQKLRKGVASRAPMF